jgi:NADH:ubiquinone reductase (H+-translocating)
VLPIPGLGEYAVGYKTLAEAVALRNRVLWNLEVAESLDEPEERREYLS